MFYFADAGWAREPFLRDLQIASHAAAGKSRPENGTTSVSESLYAAFENIWESRLGTPVEGAERNGTMEMKTGALSSAFVNATSALNFNSTPASATYGHDASILSSWTYLAQLTSDSRTNRVILDVFEGQLITCVVIIGFILVFLIREWVVQQQPLVNLDVVNNEQRERDRIEQDTERLRRQVELLNEARARLVTLQEEARNAAADGDKGSDDCSIAGERFIGWEQLESRIDEATALLRSPDRAQNLDQFRTVAHDVLRHLRTAERTGVSLSELVEKVYQKLATFSEDERSDWEDTLVRTLETMRDSRKSTLQPGQNPENGSPTRGPGAFEAVSRPQMPGRDVSFLATEVQRSLAEATDKSSADSEVTQSGPFDRDGGATIAMNVPSPSLLSDVSWQHVGQPAEEEPADDHVDISQENNDEMPITNAGHDAKLNIKLKDKGCRLVVPEPDDEKDKTITSKDLIRRLDGSHFDASSGSALPAISIPPHLVADPPIEDVPNLDNSLNSEGPAPEHDSAGIPEEESLRERVASVFREEFGLDEAEDLEHLRQGGLVPNDETAANGGNTSDQTAQQHLVNDSPLTVLQRLADYFWGDIQRLGAPERAIAPAEELVGEGDDGHEAPFVPVQDGVPAPNALPANVDPPNDPAIIAAAQQAGLDAEAVEDAEDLEGIFELIGFQGPLVGLFQTSCFCTVLVTGSVATAIGLPYVWGKLVLSLLSAPLTLLVKMPLKLASSFADIVIDIGLAVGGWLLFFAARGNAILMSWLGKWVPAAGAHRISQYLCGLGGDTAEHAGKRLLDIFITTSDHTEGLEQDWNWFFLRSSIHSHASLKSIGSAINSVLNITGHSISNSVETLSTSTVHGLWEGSLHAISQITEIPATLLAGVTALAHYTKPLFVTLGGLKTGALTFKSATVHMDPSLVYWSTTDRGLAVMIGYLSLAVVAAAYVAFDTPITSSEPGQKTEKMIRDTLRQAGGVLKVILIISIEMLAFPLYCGLLLDFAFLPLFRDGSVATRWAFAVRAPWTFCFVHWFVGTCYMFHFALFVGMCRKILRKGVLWFIRDPDDPTFHPVRDVLERNITTQLRKIAFSALVYGALVILCLGGVIWSIGHMFKGIFPIQWISTEPVLEFPMDLLLYNFLTPLLIKLFKPSNAVTAMYAWWLRRCARVLRLSHFLFDDRRKDEEGRHVRKSWTDLLLLKKADMTAVSTPKDQTNDVHFERSGKYVLTPCNDQYRPPKPGEAFLHVDDNDVYIADKEGKKNDHFAKIYVPPYFRLRVTLFMVCLWLFSAFTGLCVTLVPLVFGRQIFISVLPSEVKVNDIYAYSIGAYLLAAAAFAAFKGTSGFQYLLEKAQALDIKTSVRTSTRYAIQATKCIYVYGFLGVVLPLIFAVFLQFYLILPLHTYLVGNFGPIFQGNVSAASSANSTVGYASVSNGTGGAALARSFAEYAANLTSNANLTASGTISEKIPSLADHSIHILADYALGLLYVRIAVRLILTTPTSRASQAFHLITANGYLNPNARLATRYFVLPATIAAFVVLFAPLGLASALLSLAGLINRYSSITAFAWQSDEAIRTLIHRYSYPMAAACAFLLAAFAEMGTGLGRWRASVRDEVYLVGERLHNFGEGRPPVGSRSVVRKENIGH